MKLILFAFAKSSVATEDGGANAPKLSRAPVLVRRQRLWPTVSAVALLRRMERRVGFGELRFDTLQLAAGMFIMIIGRRDAMV